MNFLIWCIIPLLLHQNHQNRLNYCIQFILAHFALKFTRLVVNLTPFDYSHLVLDLSLLILLKKPTNPRRLYQTNCCLEILIHYHFANLLQILPSLCYFSFQSQIQVHFIVHLFGYLNISHFMTPQNFSY